MLNMGYSECTARNRCNFPRMIPDLDIYRSANLLVKQYGEDAQFHAAMRADATLEAGDLDGYAVWRRILRAVKEMGNTTPGADQAMNWRFGVAGPGRA